MRAPARSKRKNTPRGSAAVKKGGPPISLPCSTFVQGKQMLVLFSASAKQLYGICVISQREEDKDIGYQRALSPARAEKIAAFIDKGNLLPTSVLVSFGPETTLNADGTEIRIPHKRDAGWIIDGQHRLAGADKAQSDVVVPVVAFIDLSLDKQIGCFVTINKEHKGVPSSLYFDLLKHLPPSRSEAEVTKERAADLGQQMKRDEESPFFARVVSTTSPKQGELSLTQFVRKVAPLVKRDGRLHSFNDEDRQGILDNYYRALEQVFPQEYGRQNSIFFKTLGFSALMSFLPMFLDVTLNRRNAFTVADAIDSFKIIKHFDFTTWHERGTGTQSETAVADDLRTEFSDHIATTGGAIRLH